MSTTRRYQISYKVTSYYDVYVTRPTDITEDELLNSITFQEGMNDQRSGDGDDLKEAIRDKNVSLILDEEGEEIEFAN
jgi:hypothetical protein